MAPRARARVARNGAQLGGLRRDSPCSSTQGAQQQRFLDAGERTILRPRQHPQHYRGQVAGPLLHADGVAAKTTQRANPAIVVDQHQDWRAATRLGYD